MPKLKRVYKKGEVSLFVVIFSTLLLTIVTVSFVRIMIQDQQQASTIDLSQSAYDSALAGVEDAKRAILRYQSLCSQPGADPTNTTTPCGMAKQEIDNQTCNSAMKGLTDLGAANTVSEVKIQNVSRNSLDQAYTCTKVQLNTPDYIGALAKDSYEIIPLVGASNGINTVQVKWFQSTDYPSTFTNPSFPIPAESTFLPVVASWVQNRPPILRVQLIQFGSSFTLNDFNGLGASNTNTLFLYPNGMAGLGTPIIPTVLFTTDARQTPTGSSHPVICSGNISAGGYACTVNLTLPSPVGGGDRTAFLRIGALYNSTSYQVSLFNGNTLVNFNGVQPIIDSTGRANDMFRRVQSRVKLSADFPYPNAELYTSGNFCKDFIVTDTLGDYSSTCAAP